MLRLLGFVSGSLIVGATLFVLAESPQVVKKASDGELAPADIRQAIEHSKDKLQQQLQAASSPSEVTETDNKAKTAAKITAHSASTAATSADTDKNVTVKKSANTEAAKLLNNALATVTELQQNISRPASMPTAPLAIPEPTNPLTELKKIPAMDPPQQLQSLPPLDGHALNQPSAQLSTPMMTAVPGPATAPLADTLAADNQKISWHTVWDGFRSELSAKGFSRQLAKQTGRELRVERQAAGRYQVQMSYLNIDDLELGLNEIGSKTGLKLTAKTL